MKVVFGVTVATLLAVCGLVCGSTSSVPSPDTSSLMSSSVPTPTPTPSSALVTSTTSSSSVPTPTPTPSSALVTSTTSSSSSSTPSPTPTPTPPPTPVYNYVNQTSKLQLFRLQGVISVNVTFNKTVTPFMVPKNESRVLVSLSAMNTTGGATGSITANLTWNDTACSDCDFILMFRLSVVWTTGSQTWQLDEVGFVFNAPAFNITPGDIAVLTHSKALYKTSLQRAYECSYVEIGGLKSANVNLTATALVHIKEFELQAFQFTDRSKFDASPLQCGMDMPDNKIVPIAVGAALALLVIIVVIAYIIGRFRNRGKKSDYEVIQ